MAGFGKNFEINEKCLIITIVLALLYWYAPQKNWWVVGGILFFGYIAIAWYDEIYNCDNRLKYYGRTLGTMQKPLKPKVNPQTMEYGTIKNK